MAFASTDDFGTLSVKLHTSKVYPSTLRKGSLIDEPSSSCCDKCDAFKIPIFLPFGQFKSFWSLFLFPILVYSVVEIPYTIAFNGDASFALWSVRTLLGLLIDVCLSFDIVLNFRTAYIDKYDRLRYVANPSLIAKRYLSSWFIIDLFASFPFAFLLQVVMSLSPSIDIGTRAYMTFQFLRLLRLTKLLRLVKLIYMFRVVQQYTFDHLTLAILRLFKIISFMLLTAHYCACFFYGIGEYALERGQNAWVDVIIEEHGSHASNIIKYSYSFYWAIVTLFTTGYGDIHATNIYEQWTCSICILIGSCFFAYFIGSITSFLSEHRTNEYEQEKVDESLLFCAHYDLPKELRHAILTHVRYFCRYNYCFDPESIMSTLPNYLQKRVGKFCATSVLKGLDIFRTLSPNIIGQIALKLKSKSCNINQNVFEAGDSGCEMFIQRTGKSKLMFAHSSPSGTGNHETAEALKPVTIKRGDVCGEEVILSRTRHSTLKALTWSEYYILNISDIVSVLQANLDPKEATQEWEKIKNIIRRSQKQQTASVFIPHVANVPLHVSFKKLQAKDKFATYVESAVCDDRSMVPNKSVLHKQPQNYEEFEADLEKEDEKYARRSTTKRTSFATIQQMFKLKMGSPQKSSTRDESISKQNLWDKRMGAKPIMIAYSNYGSVPFSDEVKHCAVSLVDSASGGVNELNEDEDDDDYMDNNDDGDDNNNEGGKLNQSNHTFDADSGSETPSARSAGFGFALYQRKNSAHEMTKTKTNNELQILRTSKYS